MYVSSLRVGKTQIFQAHLSAAFALSQRGLPSHSHGCSRTKPSPWPAAVGQGRGRGAWAPFVGSMCACVCAQTCLSLLWASAGSSHFCPLSLPLPLPSSPSFPPPLPILPSSPPSLPSSLPLFSILLSRPHEGSREKMGLHQVPAVILSFQEYTEATSGHAGSFLTTSHRVARLQSFFGVCACVR